MKTAREANPHPLHSYIAGQLADKLKERYVVVIYDKKQELRLFFDELTSEPATNALVSVRVGHRTPKLCVYDGSFLQVRFLVEPVTHGEMPEDVLIYVPGVERNDGGSLLMELEKAGAYYRPPALKLIARNVLRKRYLDAHIDEMLKSDALRYVDYARMSRDDESSDGPSLLKSIFGVTESLTILTAWLASTEHDAEILAKAAVGELCGLLRARIGLELVETSDVVRLRANAVRYVLANEFRRDLGAAAKPSDRVKQGLHSIAEASSREHSKAISEVCQRLRERYAVAYVDLADRVENELGLEADQDLGLALGEIDTFRFEEMAVASACFNLIAAEKFEEARDLATARRDSFWVDRDIARSAVWQACRLMIDLGVGAAAAAATITKVNGNPSAWVERYVATGNDGWFQLDRMQRRLEAIVPEIEEEIPNRAIARVRALYEDAIRRMSEGFLSAFEKGGCGVPGVLHQTRIWPDVVKPLTRPIAYVLVDAMRYEIGAELSERIAKFGEIRLRHAMAALPSITPVGMAALLPGASADFSIVAQSGRFGTSIGGTFLPDQAARQRYIKTQLPDLVDLTLDDALSGSAKSLQKKIGNSQHIIIRSTEIDAAGESNTGTVSARRIMEGIIEDLARCLQRLASAGIENVVVTADHGHLFFASEREPSMRIDAPGGDTADLHRRCWVGRGGTTPPGSLRIQAAKLGYGGDLDVILPASTSVFKSGGDLAYHHGGASLQELVIPVVTARLRTNAVVKAEKNAVSVSHDFEAVTNRIFSIKVELGGPNRNLFDQARRIRPIVLAGERQVGTAQVAVGATLDGGCLQLQPKLAVLVGFILTDDTVASVRIQVLDADTDAVLYASPKDLPVRLGV
jgi:hypothetical protein